jgi:hypothetical protein
MEPSYNGEIRVDIIQEGGTASQFPDALEFLEAVEAIVEHMGLRPPRAAKGDQS